MSKRRKHTKEFKLDAVRLVTGHGYKRTEAARSLGINANMLGPGRVGILLMCASIWFVIR